MKRKYVVLAVFMLFALTTTAWAGDSSGEDNENNELVCSTDTRGIYAPLYLGDFTLEEAELQGPDTVSDIFYQMKWDIASSCNDLYLNGTLDENGEYRLYVNNTSGYYLSVDNVHTVILNALCDYPELMFAVDKSNCTVWHYTDPSSGKPTPFSPGESIRIGIVFYDLEPNYSHETTYLNFKWWVNQACYECFGSSYREGMANLTDMEKAVAAHDWIAANVQYDPYVGHNYNDFITPNGKRYTDDRKVYTSYGVFVNRNAVCMGYSLAYKIMLDRAGVECCLVDSAAMNHAWNMVRLDGQWYHVDATWDDPITCYPGDLSQQCGGTDIAGHVEHNYLLCSDAQFAYEKEHTKVKGAIDWSTEFGYSCPVTYQLSPNLAGSDTPYILFGGSMIGSYGNNTVMCRVGSDFQVAANVTLPIKPYSAALDRQSETLFFKAQYDNKIYAFDLAYGTYTTFSSTWNYSGLNLIWDSVCYGITYLYEYHIYDTKIVEGLNYTITDTEMPVVYFYASMLDTLPYLAAGSCIYQAVYDASLSVNEIIPFAAGYDADGRMVSMIQLHADSSGNMLIDRAVMTEDTVTLKIITVSKTGVPLSSAIVFDMQ
ncbi:MAG: hypothetical protein J5449_07120 [Oscillospiraceae bacterium]|nr:hypothetical protein [Oscillospiraceae bacterium]